LHALEPKETGHKRGLVRKKTAVLGSRRRPENAKRRKKCLRGGNKMPRARLPRLL